MSGESKGLSLASLLRAFGASACLSSRLGTSAAFADEFDDGVDREPRGDLAGVMSAHPVSDHAESQLFPNREAVFVGGPDPALIGEPVRQKHPSPPVGSLYRLDTRRYVVSALRRTSVGRTECPPSGGP